MNDKTDLLERVRAAFAEVPGVEEKRMFGSMGFLVRGHLCVGVRPDRIMFRIDPVAHDKAIQKNGCKTVVMRGREYRGYVQVDAQALKSQYSLERWIDRALSHNRSLPPKKKG